MKRAFSLIEMLIGLITISIIFAACAPIINKRLKAQATSLTNKLTKNCSAYGFDDDCSLCWDKNLCAVCTKGCLETQNLNITTCKCE